mmetsp:Transcript_726/g.1386  ORF Transcript_726/g.1386 Transcript_726/m.1386 type:complete len:159 (+) Transcript_726:192-668(+)
MALRRAVGMGLSSGLRVRGSRAGLSMTTAAQVPRAGLAQAMHRTGLRAFSTVKVTFVDAEGDEETVDAEVGKSMLEVCHENDIEVEGACGGEMACSTCHMIFDQDTFDSLPEQEEEEEDMLDLALGLTDTSRLGCQVFVTKGMEGIRVQLPSETSNFQ